MSTENKILVGVGTTGLSIGLAAVAAHAGWNFWPAILGIPLVFVAVAAGGRGENRPSDPEPLPELPDEVSPPFPAQWPDDPFPAPPISSMLPGVTHECELPRMRLRSAADGYDFRFSATVHWREGSNLSQSAHSDLPAVARSAIVRRAADLVAGRDPEEVAFAEAELVGALGMKLPDAAGLIEAWAGNVALKLSEADSERIRRLTEIRKDEQVWESEREYEKHRRAYLGDDVLKSAGSAVVWALSRKEDAIERAVGLIGPLALLSAAANDTEIAPVFRHLVAPEYVAQNGHGAASPDVPNTYEDYYPEPDHTPARDVPRTTPDYVAEMADHLGFTESTHRNLFVGNFVNLLKSMERQDEAESVRRAFYRMPNLEEPLFDVGEPTRGERFGDATRASGGDEVRNGTHFAEAEVDVDVAAVDENPEPWPTVDPGRP